MKYGYARVSGMGQDLEVQLIALENEGCTTIFQEKLTGKTTDRPELKKCINNLNSGDTLVVTKLDRLARNTKEGIELIEELFDKGVRVHVLNIGLLENTTTGRFFLQTLLAVAEMERSLIIERMQEGKEIAKLDPNYKEGRPKVYKRKQREHAIELLKTQSYKQVSEITGMSKSTLQRLKREMDVS